MTIFTTKMQLWHEADLGELVEVVGDVTVSPDGSEWVVALLGTMDERARLTEAEQEEAKDLLAAEASRAERCVCGCNPQPCREWCVFQAAPRDPADDGCPYDETHGFMCECSERANACGCGIDRAACAECGVLFCVECEEGSLGLKQRMPHTCVVHQ